MSSCEIRRKMLWWSFKIRASIIVRCPVQWCYMSVRASQNTGKSTICWTFCFDWQKRKHQSCAGGSFDKRVINAENVSMSFWLLDFNLLLQEFWAPVIASIRQLLYFQLRQKCEKCGQLLPFTQPRTDFRYVMRDASGDNVGIFQDITVTS